MIGSAFFDDQTPAELPQWATITEISDFLEIPRDAVRSAIRRASANNEVWVKKEVAEGGSTHYLIDTTHEMYQSHQERWKQNKALQAEIADDDISAWINENHPLFPPAHSEHPYPTVPVSWRRRQSREGVLQHWPHFRQWLYSHGIQIFQNLLAEEGQRRLWEWRWGELHGEGCESDEQAVIAALQSRFDTNEAEREEQEETTFFHLLEQQELQKRQPRFSWFRRNG